MNEVRTDEIYVGYLTVPPGLRRFLKYASAVAFGLVVGTAYVVATTQRSPGRGVWEDSASRTLTGVLACNPYPILHTADRGDGQPGSVLIVESGKHGSMPRVAEFDGKQVSLTGTVLHRDDRWMVELEERDGAVAVGVVPGSVGVGGVGEVGGVGVPATVPMGRVTLRGEIVDSKCYLGAMKPGEGKPHKECATLCIAGGVTPLLVTRGVGGKRQYYILLNPAGGPLEREAWPFIADAVEVSGELEQAGDMKRLRVNVKDIRRL